MTMIKTRSVGIVQITKILPSFEPSSFTSDLHSIGFSAIFYFSYDFVPHRVMENQEPITKSF